MRPTFFLARVFAVSALCVAGAQVVYGAPIAEPNLPSVAGAVGVEGVNVLAREVASVVGRESEIEKRVQKLADRAPERADDDDILKRMCMMVWGCKRD